MTISTGLRPAATTGGTDMAAEIFTCDCCHPPIAYTCKYCPVCDARREVEEHEKVESELQEKIYELEYQLEHGGRNHE